MGIDGGGKGWAGSEVIRDQKRWGLVERKRVVWKDGGKKNPENAGKKRKKGNERHAHVT